MDPSNPSRGSAFNTTNWSLVLEAQRDDPERARSALAALCQDYWQPLYAFARRRGHDVEEARDLTQAFFVQLLERRALEQVRPQAGRLRSFLLASMKNMLSDENARAQALKRGAGRQPVHLDVESVTGLSGANPADPLNPETIFEKRWALTVLHIALARLRDEFDRNGRLAKFDRLKPFLVGDEPSRSYREVGDELGMTEDAVKTAVHRLRKRFGQALRETIGGTVARPEDIDEEVRHLLAVLRT